MTSNFRKFLEVIDIYAMNTSINLNKKDQVSSIFSILCSLLSFALIFGLFINYLVVSYDPNNYEKQIYNQNSYT